MIKNTIFYILLISILTASCHSPKGDVNEPNVEEPSLEEMAGQMVMAGFRGLTADAVSSGFIGQIKEKKVGGVILFDYDLVKKSGGRNIESPDQVKQLISALQNQAETSLFVAVDQEGGMVNRLKTKYGFPKIASAKYLGDLDNTDTTSYYARKNAKNLNELGFNVNFAPVVDLDLNPKNPVIGKYERSFSSDIDKVVNHSAVWIGEHEFEGVISTLKHFPGHGSSDADSHEGFTDVTPYWKEAELEPFRQLLLPERKMAVMTAHVFHKDLDSIYPATLSPNVIDGILRKKWNYQGLVFSDDLQMKAVNKLFDFETIIERSILAGVDVLVYGNNLEYDENIPTKVVETIVKLVEENKIEKERIKQSYERIMEMKERLAE